MVVAIIIIPNSFVRYSKSLYNLELAWLSNLILICLIFYLDFQTLSIVCIFPRYFHLIHAFVPLVVLVPCWPTLMYTTFLLFLSLRGYLIYEILLPCPVTLGRADYHLLLV